MRAVMVSWVKRWWMRKEKKSWKAKMASLEDFTIVYLIAFD